MLFPMATDTACCVPTQTKAPNIRGFLYNDHLRIALAVLISFFSISVVSVQYSIAV